MSERIDPEQILAALGSERAHVITRYFHARFYAAIRSALLMSAPADAGAVADVQPPEQPEPPQPSEAEVHPQPQEPQQATAEAAPATPLTGKSKKR